MTGLSDGDRAIIGEIAFEAARVIAGEVKETLQAEIRLHAAECPTTKRLAAIENKGRGAWAVIAFLAAVAGAAATLTAQVLLR